MTEIVIRMNSVTFSKKTQVLWDMTPSRLLPHTNNDTKIYIYLFIHFKSIKYIPHWRILRAIEVNHICCSISKFSNRTLYSLQVRPANYRSQTNSVFVHRKELYLLLIEYPRASCKITVPSLVLSFVTGFSFISEFYHTLDSRYKN